MRWFPPNFQLYLSSAPSAKFCWSPKVELENIAWWKFCKWKIHANVNSFRSGKAQNRKISPYIYFLLIWNTAFGYESLHKYLPSSVLWSDNVLYVGRQMNVNAQSYPKSLYMLIPGKKQGTYYLHLGISQGSASSTRVSSQSAVIVLVLKEHNEFLSRKIDH